eukprot:TRINITY_DN29345_c0_g1_i1.p1 TRINITY_DN29345_c0_g1~~TRINITY_DN29345_c0_g1_i1.p1  ORF type:complete len:160 (+),score=21.19 TRINITY_DN29345_c0_g1_i1:63-542(+)
MCIRDSSEGDICSEIVNEAECLASEECLWRGDLFAADKGDESTKLCSSIYDWKHLIRTNSTSESATSDELFLPHIIKELAMNLRNSSSAPLRSEQDSQYEPSVIEILDSSDQLMINISTVTLLVAALVVIVFLIQSQLCLLYTSPSPRDGLLSRMPSSA